MTQVNNFNVYIISSLSPATFQTIVYRNVKIFNAILSPLGTTGTET